MEIWQHVQCVTSLPAVVSACQHAGLPGPVCQHASKAAGQQTSGPAGLQARGPASLPASVQRDAA